MKRMIFGTAMLAALTGTALAESWSGYLIDSMCSRGQDPAKHTKECVLKCAKSGLGLMTADGKFLKFDQSSQGKAMAALKATAKTDELKASVSGTLQGETIKVDKIEIR